MLILLNLFTTLSDKERELLHRKFDIAHFVVVENLPFTKYSMICKLDAHHGV